MAGDVVPIARLRRRRLQCARSGGIADDRGWLASHDRLLEGGALARVLLISREPAGRRSTGDPIYRVSGMFRRGPYVGMIRAESSFKGAASPASPARRSRCSTPFSPITSKP